MSMHHAYFVIDTNSLGQILSKNFLFPSSKQTLNNHLFNDVVVDRSIIIPRLKLKQVKKLHKVMKIL